MHTHKSNIRMHFTPCVSFSGSRVGLVRDTDWCMYNCVCICMYVYVCVWAGMKVHMSMWGDKVLEVVLPVQAEYVVHTHGGGGSSGGGGGGGSSGGGGYQPVTLDSGATVHVPMFVRDGDRVILSTEDGGVYVGRGK